MRRVRYIGFLLLASIGCREPELASASAVPGETQALVEMAMKRPVVDKLQGIEQCQGSGRGLLTVQGRNFDFSTELYLLGEQGAVELPTLFSDTHQLVAHLGRAVQENIPYKLVVENNQGAFETGVAFEQAAAGQAACGGLALKWQETNSPGYIHQRIAWHAVDLLQGAAYAEFSAKGVRGATNNRSDIKVYCSGPETCSSRCCKPSNRYLLAGADEEDQGTGFFPRPCNGFFWFRHFWHNEGGFNDGLLGYDSAAKVALSSWRLAVESYRAGERDKGYYYLGHVAHLLGDIGTPAHLSSDQHACGDSYERYVNTNYNTFAGEGLPVDHAKLSLNPVGGRDYRQDKEVRKLSADERSLFKLLLHLAEEADDYDSDDRICPPEEPQCFHFAMRSQPVPAFGSAVPKLYIKTSSGTRIRVDQGDYCGAAASWAPCKRASYSTLKRSACSGCKHPDKQWLLISDDFERYYNARYRLAEQALYADFGQPGGVRTVRFKDFSLTRNFIGDPEALRMAAVLIPRTVQYVAGAYQLFHETVH